MTQPNQTVAEQPRLRVAMLLYPGPTLLDLVGPQTALSMHSDIRLVWKTRDAITTDTGIRIEPDTTFADCPKDLDVLFVPGGFGTAGVTAGIDFGLTLLAQLRGEDAARLSQLAMEYDPAPPFDAGSPGSAGAAITVQARAFVASKIAAAAAPPVAA
jgi:transcriptional regulator GlxA family with amidase domain